MEQAENVTSIVGYLCGNSLVDGFIQVSVNDQDIMNSSDICHLFSRRRTHQTTFMQEFSPAGDIIVIIFDVSLHSGPSGLIRMPIMLLKATGPKGSFINLGPVDTPDIEAIIER